MGEVPIPQEEVQPPPPPAEPPPFWKTSSETDAMMLAAIHPYGHEEPLETSRTLFESMVRDGFFFEEDTLEDLLTRGVVGGVNRELDLMKSFPVYQAVPRAEVTGKVWSTRWCYRRKKGTQATFCGEIVYNFYGRKFLQTHSWARDYKSFVSNGSVEKTLPFSSVI